jgi:uncharacterized protein (DUF58 family)
MSDQRTAELLKKVRKIELKTKGLSNQLFSGEYHSAFKGRGMAFSEVREYAPGDEIRTIDWNVTARTGVPHVKVFEEERELTVILLVDISGSDNFGTQVQSKRELITELCAVLAFSATQNNDKVGVIFFSSAVEKYIPPKKGRSHILQIIRELLNFKPAHTGTDIGEALRFFNNVVKKRSTAFLISDFLDDGFKDVLKVAGRKHDLIGLQVLDKRELDLPRMGLVKFHDLETGRDRWVNTSSKKVRAHYAHVAETKQVELKDIFARSGVDWTTIMTDQSYVKPLMKLFKRR